MSGTYTVNANVLGYTVSTTDCYPEWAHEGDFYVLFLYAWDDDSMVFTDDTFTTSVTTGSTCCQTSTGNSYESPLGLTPGCHHAFPDPCVDCAFTTGLE